MANVLAQIVANKRIEINTLKKTKPLSHFINELKPSKKDLYAALSAKNAGFILECKKASPSKGLIRPDFNVTEIAQTYDKYAAGISVLTDKKYFQGTFEYLQQVTQAVKSPVLNKDFFIDVYQVYLARYYGADAILLMLSVLNDEEYQALAKVAEQFKLAILTEVSNQEELDRAIALNAKLIGINNRNLRDLSTDITRTVEFAPKIPDGTLVISESGIYTNEQVRELAPIVDGFLVGSSVMAQDDVDLACRTLIFGNNKVCGLTRVEDAQAAKVSGAVYGGLIFAEKSPRCIDQDTAQLIISNVAGLKYVGVFVNETIEIVAKLANTLSLDAVQLHGDEQATDISKLATLLPKSCQLWKATPVIEQVPALTLKVDKWILDSQSPGSGQPFRWQVLANTKQDLSTCFLAGGLGINSKNETNIDTAIDNLQQNKLFGLDLNSGVEHSPGIKSDAKLQQVFAQIRNY